jgi:hypothetical protein
MTVQTYNVSTWCISPLENIFVTGGQKIGLAVFSLWNVQTTDSETSIHPCGTPRCMVIRVAFPNNTRMELKTGCKCGKICTWDIGSRFPSLIEEASIGMGGSCMLWADNGSKALFRRNLGGIETEEYFCDLWVDISIHYELRQDKEDVYDITADWVSPDKPSVQWMFSPEQGEMILRWRRPQKWYMLSEDIQNQVDVWECSSGCSLFDQKIFVGERMEFI